MMLNSINPIKRICFFIFYTPGTLLDVAGELFAEENLSTLIYR